MTQCVVTHDDSSAHDDERPVRKLPPQSIIGGLALALITLACGWTLYTNLAASTGDAVLVAPPVLVKVEAPSAAFYLDPVLLNPARPLGFAPRTFAQSVPRPAEFRFVARTPAETASSASGAAAQPVVRTVQSVPLPTPRPADLGLAQLGRPSLQAQRGKPNDPFEKLFGTPETTGSVLAYAAPLGAGPDGGVSDDKRGLSLGRTPTNDGQTAIYDITAQTVHLPDGTKLEAHSGLGPKMDDPRHVNVRMHGATPPHVYDLIPREALFHGVEALRLIPVGGEGAIFGRTGLLTHTYLLGPRGDSNGCISFKDYDTFLQAYKSGKVKRMVVVASLDDPQISVGTWERARTASAARRERTTTAAWSGERGATAAWAQTWSRDRTTAPFARVD
jgi:hypothetical protein